jgi:hypothetical protein
MVNIKLIDSMKMSQNLFVYSMSLFVINFRRCLCVLDVTLQCNSI